MLSRVEAAARQLDRLQLVRVTDDGKTTRIVSAGVALLTMLFEPAPVLRVPAEGR